MFRAPAYCNKFLRLEAQKSIFKFRADILSDIYSHRNLKIDFHGLRRRSLAISHKLLYNKENSGIRAKMPGSFLTGAGRRKTENYEKT